MSCNGWSVGERCRAESQIVFQAKNRKDRPIVVRDGDEGSVEAIRRDQHIMTVYWDRLQQTLELDHDQIHQIRKLESGQATGLASA